MENTAGAFGQIQTTLCISPIMMRNGGNHANFKFNAQDIRFVVGKDHALYAFTMNIPGAGEKIIIRSMAKEKGFLTSKVKEVKLLGYKGKIKWQMTEEGLELTYPEVVSLKTAATWRIVTK